MKITPKELKQIIKEELEAVKEKVVKRGDKYAYVSKKGKTLGTHDTKAGAEKQATAIRISRNVGEGIEEGRYRQATLEPELYDALKDAVGNHSEYLVFGVLRGVFDDRADARKAAELNEDGHTDVPSAVRKLKTSMEDAMEILSALEQMPDTELPSWWMSKITLAADYLNKSRDYLLVSEKLDPSDGAGAYVKDFRKSDAPQFKGKGKKKRQQMAIAAYLQDKEEGK